MLQGQQRALVTLAGCGIDLLPRLRSRIAPSHSLSIRFFSAAARVKRPNSRSALRTRNSLKTLSRLHRRAERPAASLDTQFCRKNSRDSARLLGSDLRRSW